MSKRRTPTHRAASGTCGADCTGRKGEAVAALPEELAAAAKPDDHYLIQAQLAVDGAIVVTTDNPLREALDSADLPCISREEFLRRVGQI
jgi:hypothetical protein